MIGYHFQVYVIQIYNLFHLYLPYENVIVIVFQNWKLLVSYVIKRNASKKNVQKYKLNYKRKFSYFIIKLSESSLRPFGVQKKIETGYLKTTPCRLCMFQKCVRYGTEMLTLKQTPLMSWKCEIRSRNDYLKADPLQIGIKQQYPSTL